MLILKDFDGRDDLLIATYIQFWIHKFIANFSDLLKKKKT